MTKCECNEQGIRRPEADFMYSPEEEAGREHNPGECKGTYDLAEYHCQDGTVRVLCSCCHMPGDERIEK